MRYDKAKWLNTLCNSGAIRFRPASNYKNELIGSPRYDDELNHNLFIRGDRVKLTTERGEEIPIIGHFTTTIGTAADFYIQCWSNEFDDRLFDEFSDEEGPADSCCVIWNVEEFSRRLENSIAKILPEWTVNHFPISYFDPYENGKNYISPGANKKSSFAYQREYRFFLDPPGACSLSKPIDFNIGPLADIVTVYKRDGSILAGKTLSPAA